MILVALAMVAIIAMAALSIDVITLYLAREEAQRSADAAALAAARVISISGITGDPGNSTLSWQAICGGSTSPATQAAIAVATQSAVGGIAVPTPTVLYSAGGSAPVANCSGLPAAFGVNPMVTVQLTRPSLPTFFSRIWGNTGNSVSATATAEAFNPSASDLNTNGGPTGAVTPVQPRCVKPWIVPNRDPLNPSDTCDQGGGPCNKFVSLADGSITKPGISLNGNNATGVIGETFWLAPDCVHTGSRCSLRANPPEGNYYAVIHRPWLEPPPSLQYLPGEAPAVAPVAVPSCASSGSAYEESVGGCDQTIYQCGLQSLNPNQVDLDENPGAGTNDTMNGVQCLIHQTDATDITSSSGQDYLAGTSFAAPSPYPFQILAGSGNPLVTVANPPLTGGTPITSSASIVSLPIYDDTAATINPNGTSNVTIVGFLQVFINAVDRWGNVDVTVLNVSGCGNGTTTPNAAVTGSSPVPVRLITPP
jgi:hypothetical protein